MGKEYIEYNVHLLRTEWLRDRKIDRQIQIQLGDYILTSFYCASAFLHLLRHSTVTTNAFDPIIKGQPIQELHSILLRNRQRTDDDVTSSVSAQYGVQGVSGLARAGWWKKKMEHVTVTWRLFIYNTCVNEKKKTHKNPTHTYVRTTGLVCVCWPILLMHNNIICLRSLSVLRRAPRREWEFVYTWCS